MNSTAVHAAQQLVSVAPSQLVETAERITTLLRDGGPWALLALTLVALAWMTKQYIAARDAKDTAMAALNVELTGLLKQVIQTAAEQKASNEQVHDALERLERK